MSRQETWRRSRSVKRLGEDNSKFGALTDHPAANEAGYVKTPNVNTLIEVMDMREAQRSMKQT